VQVALRERLPRRLPRIGQELLIKDLAARYTEEEWVNRWLRQRQAPHSPRVLKSQHQAYISAIRIAYEMRAAKP
jgi:hypothetical protein